MKIAQIAPIAERVPPKKYGGTERVVYALTEHLIAAGHDVTLFATGDSLTSANLVSVFPRGLREARVADPHGINEWTLLNIGLAYKLQENFDIIHDHNFPISLPAANIAKVPVVMTVHSAISPHNKRLLATMNNINFVSISKSQVKKQNNLNFVGTVYNGLDFDKHVFKKRHEGYLLFVGRISREKGVHHAIEVAQYLNTPLIIAAKVDDVDQPYFKQYIEPKLDGELIKWVGETDEKERNELYAGAMAFLHPATWPEPFGLTLIEAMASGCPVIGFNQGSIPEVIIHGKTGFIANDVEEMIEYVVNIDKIDRATCREHALQNFNANNMTAGYETVYRKVLESERKKMEEFRVGARL